MKQLAFFVYITLLVVAFDLGRRIERARAPKPLPVPVSATIVTSDGKGKLTTNRIFICSAVAGAATSTSKQLDHIEMTW